MQVKKRLQINIAFSVMAAVVIAGILILTLSGVNRARQQRELVGDIRTSSFERITFRSDYIRTGSERAKLQWFTESEGVSRLLKAAAEQFEVPGDKRTIAELSKDNEAAIKLFSGIVRNRERARSGLVSAVLSQEVESRLVAQLNMRLYDEVLQTNRLRKAAEAYLHSSLTLAGWSIFIVIAGVSAAAILNSWTIGRTIIHRIQLLRHGTSIIEDGKLDHRIEIKGNDEFAGLSAAFNAMTAKLSASYLNLEREIGERKRIEETLREQQSRLELANQAAQIGSFEYDIQANVNKWSREIEALYGLPKGGFGGTFEDFQRRIHSEDWPLVQERIQSAMVTGEYSGDFRVIRPDGTVRWLQARARVYHDQKGKPLKTVGVNMDITERKRAEEALRESEQRLRFHVENSVMAVVEWDASFHVTRWAGEAEKVFGWSADETVGKPIMDLHIIYEADISLANRTMEKLTGGRERTVVSANRNYTKSGAVIDCIWYNSVLVDARGRMASVMSLVQDVTERKRAERKIIDLNRELTRNVTELASSNKELEAFIYSVAHDLRAPLRSIAGYSDILVGSYADKIDDTGRRYFERVLNGAEQMNRIIDDLLRLSRISRHEVRRQDVDMSGIAKSTLAELQAAHPERRIGVTLKDGVHGFADAALMQIVLSNLLDNAWKFTSKSAEARIEFGAADQHGETVYYVKDNGAGFDQTLSEKTFLPFHRLHKEHEFEGTGIGLAIVERVVRRHGGKIWAEGKPGEGAAFFFTLAEIGDGNEAIDPHR